MATTWKIILDSNGEVVKTGTGTEISYEFPPNENDDDENYIIQVESDSCTESLIYTVPPCDANECVDIEYSISKYYPDNRPYISQCGYDGFILTPQFFEKNGLPAGILGNLLTDDEVAEKLKDNIHIIYPDSPIMCDDFELMRKELYELNVDANHKYECPLVSGYAPTRYYAGHLYCYARRNGLWYLANVNYPTDDTYTVDFVKERCHAGNLTELYNDGKTNGNCYVDIYIGVRAGCEAFYEIDCEIKYKGHTRPSWI